MSFNREKYEYFFPSKVYRCVCVAGVIQKCFDEDSYSLAEIVDELNNHSFFDEEKKKVFSIKCGDQNKDCIFMCETHLSIVLFAKKQFACTDLPTLENTTITYSDGKKETFCKGCIKHYLKTMYHYFYFHDFNLECS